MGIQARGSGFQVKVMVRGERHTGTFKTREEAEAWEADVRAAAARGQSIPEPGSGSTKAATIKTMRDLWDHTKRVHWDALPSGEGAAQRALHFIEWVGPRMPVASGLSTETIHRYWLHRTRDLRNSNCTANKYLSYISNMVTEVAEPMGLIQARPRMPWKRVTEHRVRFFEVHEEQDIHAYLHRMGPTYDRWRWYFIVACDMGCRPKELKGLRWSDIRGRNFTIHASESKTYHTRTLTMTPRVLDAIEALRVEFGHLKGPFVWVQAHTLRNIWADIRGACSWMDDECIPYTFRHTCASRLAMDGASEVQIMRWMGHTSSATTHKYMHLSPRTMDDMAARLTRQAQPVSTDFAAPA